MVHINNVKNNVFTSAPGIMFPVLSYTMVETKPINKKSGTAIGRKEPK